MNRGTDVLVIGPARGAHTPDLGRDRGMIVFPLTDREGSAIRWLGRSMWLVGSAAIASLLWLSEVLR